MTTDTLEFLRKQKVAYQLAFGAAGAADAIEDLRQFCKAEKSCFHPDPYVHALLQGRREVFLRIQGHLTMEPEALAQFYRAVVPETKGHHDDD